MSTLRGTHTNKFKNRPSGSGNLQDILKRAQFQKKKSIFDETADGENAPNFDCSGGLRLSGSSGSEDEDDGPSTSHAAKKGSSSLINTINQASGGTMHDLKSVHDNYQRIEDAKAKMMMYKQKDGDSQKENLNIADLLAMGESASSSSSVPTTSKKSSQKRKAQKEDSDSEGWEEVEGKRVKIPRYMKVLKRFEFDG